MERFSGQIFSTDLDEIFVLAANDGQLIEAWHAGADGQYRSREGCLREAAGAGSQLRKRVRLRLFHLSRQSSVSHIRPGTQGVPLA